MKFQKKPAFFEAEQWFPNKQVEGVYEPLPGDREYHKHYVMTAHNQLVFLEAGDWIVREPNGNGYYPIKAEIMPTIADPV